MADTDRDYFIADNGETMGPYALSQNRSMWEHGEISSKAMYATEGDTEWRRIRELVETSGLPLKEATPKTLPKTDEADEITLAWDDVKPAEVENLPAGMTHCRVCGGATSGNVCVHCGANLPKQEDFEKAKFGWNVSRWVGIILTIIIFGWLAWLGSEIL